GNSVAINGENILISSLWDNDNNSVSAYLFSTNVQSKPTPAPVPEPSLILGMMAVFIFGSLSCKQHKMS
ncbi:MAG: PEP-CTERM sorting domain-containing protein, partial [Microcoleaceae cyanobacterium]